MNVFIVSVPNEQERKRTMGIQNGFEKFFVFLRFNIISDDVYNFCQKIQVWKLVWILWVWSENGCGK